MPYVILAVVTNAPHRWRVGLGPLARKEAGGGGKVSEECDYRDIFSFLPPPPTEADK